MGNLKRVVSDGVLALWNDCKVGDEATYEAWYQSEHLFERLRVPGFLRGRRFQRITGCSEYFTYYETESPEVMSTSEYLKLLDNPSFMTEQVMRGTFLNMSRTVCRVLRRFGSIYGAFAVTIKLNNLDTVEAVSAYAESLFKQSSVTRAEIWIADLHYAGIKNREEALRGGDQRIKACLIVETLREGAAREISKSVYERFDAATNSVGCYQLLCDIQSDRDK